MVCRRLRDSTVLVRQLAPGPPVFLLTSPWRIEICSAKTGMAWRPPGPFPAARYLSGRAEDRSRSGTAQIFGPLVRIWVWNSDLPLAQISTTRQVTRRWGMAPAAATTYGSWKTRSRSAKERRVRLPASPAPVASQVAGVANLLAPLDLHKPNPYPESLDAALTSSSRASPSLLLKYPRILSPLSTKTRLVP